MFRVMPALESYMIANVATQNLMGGNPLQVLFGDLNAQAGTGALGQLMGPQPGVISIKELLTGTMNAYQIGSGSSALASTGYSTPSAMLPGATVTGITTAGMAPIDAVAQNFKNNVGNIIVGTTLTTAGFRIANKVLRKPKSKMNKLLRDVGLGATVQL
tara:strand:+ start:141 stop:617 length:477 start_codon:yes stop_codon:yes gene_type:complete